MPLPSMTFRSSRSCFTSLSLLVLLLLSLQQHPTLAQDEVPTVAPSSAPSSLSTVGTSTSPSTVGTSTPSSLFPNECDNVTIGNFYFLIVNSLDSADEVSLFGFEDLPPGMDLYLTDNAWTGETFATNEGVMVMTTPSSGIPAGVAFGLGPSTSAYAHGQDWTNAQGVFSLSTEGEQVFLFCLSAARAARPIAAISYNGPFQPAGLAAYGTNESALPDSLAGGNGTIVLPHEDRWTYDGPNSLEINALKAAIQDTASNWRGTSDESAAAKGGHWMAASRCYISVLLAVTALAVMIG